jgi:hypothetical protein
MAEKDDKLIIEIELDDGKLAKGFINAKEGAGKAGKKAGDDFGDQAYRAANNGLGKLKSALFGLGAAFVSAFAVREMINGAKVQENAVNELNSALGRTGQYTRQASLDFQAFASKLQSSSRIGDEVILQNAALIQSLGKLSVEALKPATQAALDMSEALGIDLRSASVLVGKAASGEIGAFTRYGVVIEKGANSAETFANTLRALNAQFGGAAQAKVNTFEGAFTQLKNTFGDLLEEFGNYLIKSPAIIATFKIIAKELGLLITRVATLAKSDEGIKGLSDTLLALGKNLTTFVIRPVEGAINTIKALFSGLQTGLAAILALFAKVRELGSMLDLKLGIKTQEEFDAIKAFSDASIKAFQDLGTESRAALEGMGDFSISDGADRIVGEIADMASKIKIGMNDVKNNLTEPIKEGTDAAIKKMEAFKNQIGVMLLNGLTRVVGTGMEAIGAALVNGGKAFENFGYTVLGIIGDLASQLGAAYIAIGVGVEAVKASVIGLVGGPAIAAGISLMILGGALKAFAAKGSATASAASVPVATGSDSFGGRPFDQTTIQQPEVQRDTTPSINVNIQGDVLDGQESGRRIVDIINDAFGREGVRINRGVLV